ncbi:uncharacterized protein LOC107217543 [Neodiprion lecontei]|uniref:Uncharacterized protein LOC107217543 n=1 Tax=Neodiprion lecontei TaxID=441921 RepID=A0ABM3GNU7_NEOLC|nr:uncharacterized protein LOC107217543 [Neodiprion lecontei]
MFSSLTAKLEDLSNKNTLLSARIDDLEDTIPELEGEDLLAIFVALTTQLSVDVPPTDVLEIGRIKSTSDSNKPRLILCRLRSVQCRNRLLAAKRAKGPIYANQLGLPHDQLRTPIFINEHLPPTLSKFLGKVRAYAKERGYRFIWTRNGLVYVKRDASSDHILIKSEADLQLLSHRT